MNLSFINMMMKKYSNRKIALVSCSNGLSKTAQAQVRSLKTLLEELGCTVVIGQYLFAGTTPWSASGAQRAEMLMTYFKDPSITDIFDLSGGDLANEILPYLNYSVIAESKGVFWGYSDLTAVINALYSQCQKPSILWQPRFLLGAHHLEQRRQFEAVLQSEPDAYKDLNKRSGKLFSTAAPLFNLECRFIQGSELSGVLIGGNIRCLLKLAGTKYWPDMQNKILLLESLSGSPVRIASMLNQLSQIGVFNQVSGVLLGTFTEADPASPSIEALLLPLTEKQLPIARTPYIGHGDNARAAVIGQPFYAKKLTANNKIAIV